MHISCYYYVFFLANEVEICSHYTQEFSVYMSRQDRLVCSECVGCYEDKEGQSLTQWGLVTGACGKEVWRGHLENYPTAGSDP